MKAAYTALALALFSFSCNKKESQNTKVSGDFSTKTIGTHFYAYKALDGKRAKVTFENKDNSGTITILSNGKSIQLDRKGNTGNITNYERNGLTAVAFGDSIKIMQDGTEIPLVRDIVK